MGAANKFADDTDPRGGMPGEGPDAQTKAAGLDATANAVRARDGITAGKRGSNHVGQGSDAGTMREAKSDGEEESTHIRKGNSEQSHADENQSQKIDPKLEDARNIKRAPNGEKLPT